MCSRKGLYKFAEIERKWQRFWEEHKTFKAVDCDNSRTKYYVLDMFPYPSAAGLHVGHPEGYTASDIVARYKRMKGFNVLHPMGWDAFGLPAEQYAIDTGTHPAQTTQKNVDRMRQQIKSLGFSYDWDREVNTTDPEYYKWTQWIFLKFFNSYYDDIEQKAKPIEQLPIPHGLSQAEQQAYIDDHRLAYEAEVPVNWCPALGTVLANEEVVGGLSERGGHPVIRRPMRQWMLRITKYAERLLKDLDEVDWPESIKKLQKDWIGKSIGAEVTFQVDGFDEQITIFTTRPDTLFGATYMVLAPEHPLVDKITAQHRKKPVEQYRADAARKSDLDRTDLAKEKTGEPLDAYAINPVNGERIPIWISDYVLISYGTGAIMAVPAHDERDFEFANKYGLDIIPVVEPDRKTALSLPISTAYHYDGPITEYVSIEEWAAIADSIIEEVRSGGAPFTRPVSDRLERQVIDLVGDDTVAIDEIRRRLWDYVIRSQCNAGEGRAINSGKYDGMPTAKIKEEITKDLEQAGLGKKAVNYKLRDWLFSRQRYWGEPFPLLHKQDGRVIGLCQENLPLELPPVENYEPPGTGESPLASIGEWVYVTLPDGSKAKRETNTMPQWAGSCWYYLRYLDPDNDRQACGQEKEKYWMPVDLYIGGAEHAVLHLLYARFWHKFLYDLGYVSTKEPFKKLVNQGMILGEDGQKMSKSRGNVVNPDKVVTDYGADSMRLYEMFMGPLEQMKPWSMRGVEGVYRFCQRVWRLIVGWGDRQEGRDVWVTMLHDPSKSQPEPAEPDGTVEKEFWRMEKEGKFQPAEAAVERALHRTIKKVGDDIEAFKFNTAISAMMEFINAVYSEGRITVSQAKRFVLVLAPFAPHLAEELWQRLGHEQSLACEPWPQYDQELAKEKEIELAVQVNGKIKDRIVVAADADEKLIQTEAQNSAKVKAAMAGKPARKIIVVKPRIVSIIT